MVRHAIAVAVAVLVSSSLSAQSADVAVAIRLINQPLLHASAEYALDVANRGPSRATAIEVVWTMPSENFSYDNRCRPNGLDVICAVASLDAGESVTFRAGVSLREVTILTTTARAQAAESDPAPANNTATLTHGVIDPSRDLELSFFAPDRLDTQNRGVYRLVIANTSTFDAPDATITFSFATNTRIVDVSPALPCPDVNGRMLCRIGLLAAGESREYAVNIEHPTPEGHYSMFVALTWAPDQFAGPRVAILATLYRRFAVASIADDGAGSLRRAILDVNEQCARDGVPCMIEFSGALTVAPSSPLPMVLAPEILIDGAGTTLRGEGVSAGDGLFIAADRLTVLNLNVTGFRGNGLLLVPLNPGGPTRAMTIEKCTANGNGLRGIMAYGLSGAIEDSVFSHNDRSGLFIVSSQGLGIRGNDIVGNGASGVYIGPNSTAVIAGNSIVGNLDFGVAIGNANSVQVLANTLHSNGRAIDIGLDGPTLENAPPQILTGFYDVGSGETVISGVSGAPANYTRYSVLLYASHSVDRDGFGEGETYLGTADAGGDGRFTFRYHGDLRGRFVSGVTIRTLDFGDFISHQTSEFGRPATVE